MSPRYNYHKLIRTICLALCLFIFATLFVYHIHTLAKDNVGLEKVYVKSSDGSIDVSFDSSNLLFFKGVHIEIMDGKRLVEEADMPLKGEYSFRNGKYGKAYDINIMAIKKDGSYANAISERRLFLDYNTLPDLSLITVNTYSGENPTYDEAVKSDPDFFGETKVNNVSLPSSFEMKDKESSISLSNAMVAIRGNTSAVYYEKKPYKIELNEPYDLLGLGSEYALRDWVLLNNAYSIRTYIGHMISEFVDMEWQVPIRFVQLMLNGDYMGSFYLVPDVDFAFAGNLGLVSQDGYIFENDIYWWAEDGAYFKTNNQLYQMAYTFKYPRIKNDTDERLKYMARYMQEFEDNVLINDLNYKNYIDEESFATWILAREILGNGDGGGTNMYLYKYDNNVSNPTATKVKLGPLWDFDGVFFIRDDYSDCRREMFFWYNKLFEDEEFNYIYNTKWKERRGELIPFINDRLDSLNDEQGEAITDCWELEKARWQQDIEPLDSQISYAKEFLTYRASWIDNNLLMKDEY